MTTALTLYGRLRYCALLNVLIALVPSLQVKGRANDPLLGLDWWPHAYHSAVFVVIATALLGLGAAYAMRRLDILEWWAYCLCAGIVGALPGLFYWAATPADALVLVPIENMLLSGILFGLPVGALIALLLRGGFTRHRA
jgi:hypothetical protein